MDEQLSQLLMSVETNEYLPPNRRQSNRLQAWS